MRRTSLAATIALLALLALTVFLLFGAGSSRARAAEAPAAPVKETVTISTIGQDLDRARLLPLDQRGPALAEVSRSFTEQMKKGMPEDERRAASFLSGEIQYSMGNYGQAAEAFQKAERDGNRGPFADDAAFGAVIATEGAGKDAEAARAWMEWEKRYPKSPLLPEARLGRSWNALRRGAVTEAAGILTALGTSAPWMTRDPRFVLARATAAYMDGRAADALSILEGSRNAAPEMYLKALCSVSRGDVLKAAAFFQEASDRGVDPALRDNALLAKANTFLAGKAYLSAADEFARVAQIASSPDVRGEAELRNAASIYLAGDAEKGIEALRQTSASHAGTPVAARAQYLLGEVLYEKGRYADAIVELNAVLTTYFEHDLAAAAQYCVGRCLDALGRQTDATSTYQAVVSGYPMAPEAPAASYLAGVGLMDANRPLDAVPYFQLVLDRYAKADTNRTLVFSTPEQRELVEASLCLLELSYHRAGNLGQLAGAPHLLLTKMPPSPSLWRAYALLIDADAMAAMGRYPESQTLLATLTKEFPNQDVSVRATRLLAWTYARQGKDDLAVETEEGMLARYATLGDVDELSSAYLNKAHVLMNRKQYKEAALAYEDFLTRFPSHGQASLALYQLGLAYHRLDRDGDAVDRWERIVSLDPTSPIAEKAWTRAADIYFQAEHYDESKRCYEGLLEHFGSSAAAARASLRIAQCEYNAGRDPEALERYSQVIASFPGTREADEAGRGIELSLYRLGQKDNAGEVLAQLIEKYPQSSFAADAQFQMAMSKYREKDFAGAADAFRQVVSRFPGYSAADRASFLAADSYAQAGAKADARLGYEQFLIFFPQSELRSTVQFRLGAMRFEEGNYLQAAVDFTALLEANPSAEMAAPALYNLALCQKLLGQNDEARASLERYRTAYPTDERACDVAMQLADIYDQSGSKEAAVAELERAAASAPPQGRTTELQYRLGMAREAGSNLEGALRAYQKAIDSPEKADPYRLSALARAAAIYEGQGKTERALAAYRDLMRNATDPELVAAAEERVGRLKQNSQ